jgi:hypothetical protein
MGEREVRLAAKLYQARDQARRFLGVNYAGVVAEWVKYVQAEVERTGKSALAAVDLSAAQTFNPTAQMLILAAAVEMVEPTPAEVAPC